MLIAIRCDASAEIGGGHVARCLTLAQALVARGMTALFLCRKAPSDVVERIRSIPGIGFCPLQESNEATQPDHGPSLAHRHWLGVTQAVDARETASVLAKRGAPDWLVVDHYGLDARWEGALRGIVGKVLVVDDLDDRHHDADLLLDQNLVSPPQQRYTGHVSPSCKLLLGPRFALLRPEFAEARRVLRTRVGALKRLLVFFGSYDPTNLTLETLYGIEGAQMPGVEVDVVLGAGSPHRAEIAAYCRDRAGYEVHVQASNMATLMARADLAIGASGATTWERCCLGLPSMVFAIAENQTPIAVGCESAGAVMYLGRGSNVSRELIAASLRHLADDPTKLRNMSQAGMKLVDALGVQRVCNAMLTENANLDPVL